MAARLRRIASQAGVESGAAPAGGAAPEDEFAAVKSGNAREAARFRMTMANAASAAAAADKTRQEEASQPEGSSEARAHMDPPQGLASLSPSGAASGGRQPSTREAPDALIAASQVSAGPQAAAAAQAHLLPPPAGRENLRSGGSAEAPGRFWRGADAKRRRWPFAALVALLILMLLRRRRREDRKRDLRNP